MLQFFQGPLQVDFGFLVEGGPEFNGALEAFGGLFVLPIHKVMHPDIVIGLSLIASTRVGLQGLGILLLGGQRRPQQQIDLFVLRGQGQGLLEGGGGLAIIFDLQIGLGQGDKGGTNAKQRAIFVSMPNSC